MAQCTCGYYPNGPCDCLAPHGAPEQSSTAPDPGPPCCGTPHLCGGPHADCHGPYATAYRQGDDPRAESIAAYRRKRPAQGEEAEHQHSSECCDHVYCACGNRCTITSPEQQSAVNVPGNVVVHVNSRRRCCRTHGCGPDCR